MSDATQTEPTDAPAAPTQAELAGLFKAVRTEEAGPAPEVAAEPEPEVAPEPEQDGEETTQDFEAGEELAEPADEPDAANVQPTIPPPAGMTQAQIDAFGALSPEMQQFVAGQDAHRTADYQRKTTELARERRETEALRGQYVERLQSQIETLESQVAQRPRPPDPALRDSDPDAYEMQRDAYMLSVHEAQEQREQLETLRGQRAEEIQRAQQDFLAEQSALLPSLIPESTDPAKWSKIQKDVAEYAMGKGYTPAQLGGLRAIDLTMLYQSMQWERASKAAPATGGKPRPKAPKAQRPGTAKTTPAGDNKAYRTARKAFDAAPTKRNLAGLFRAERNA